MPTVLRIGPYRFHFYSREANELPRYQFAADDCLVYARAAVARFREVRGRFQKV
jgi:hypothetical protein